MNRRDFIALTLPALAGCVSISPQRYTDSDTYVALRKKSAGISLEEKAAYFEERVPLVDGMVPRHSQGAPFFDVTVQYLAALAAKQKVKPTVKTAKRIDDVLGAITSIPLRDISSNKHAQLFFAYSMMQKHPKVKEHAAAIEASMFDHDLVLPGTFSDLRV